MPIAVFYLLCKLFYDGIGGLVRKAHEVKPLPLCAECVHATSSIARMRGVPSPAPMGAEYVRSRWMFSIAPIILRETRRCALVRLVLCGRSYPRNDLAGAVRPRRRNRGEETFIGGGQEQWDWRSGPWPSLTVAQTQSDGRWRGAGP